MSTVVLRFERRCASRFPYDPVAAPILQASRGGRKYREYWLILFPRGPRLAEADRYAFKPMEKPCTRK